jgi:hypothetical protein
MHELNAEIVELIECEIKYPMYYIEYPEDVPQGIWKDGAGKYHYISDMGLDHLKASARLVERDIQRLEQSGRAMRSAVRIADASMPTARR